MNYTSGLKYKPIMDRNVAKLLIDGALVHMLEFSIDGTEKNNENLAINDFLENLVNGIAGKSTGRTSEYRTLNSFDENIQSFVAMPTTTIKKGFPFEFFATRNNVGLVITPNASSSFVYLSGDDAFSNIIPNNKVCLMPEFLNGDMVAKLLEINVGNLKDAKKSNTIKLPVIRSEQDEKLLRNYFNNDFFNLYSGGLSTNDKNFLNKFKDSTSSHTSGLCCMNEIGLNFASESIKAIIIYSDPIKKRETEYKEGFKSVEGAPMANLLKEMIKQRTQIDLPIIHYNLKEKYTKPIINEVRIEPEKIVAAIENSEIIKKSYETYLGKEYVNNLLAGKTNFRIR